MIVQIIYKLVNDSNLIDSFSGIVFTILCAGIIFNLTGIFIFLQENYHKFSLDFVLGKIFYPSIKNKLFRCGVIWPFLNLFIAIAMSILRNNFCLIVLFITIIVGLFLSVYLILLFKKFISYSFIFKYIDKDLKKLKNEQSKFIYFDIARHRINCFWCKNSCNNCKNINIENNQINSLCDILLNVVNNKNVLQCEQVFNLFFKWYCDGIRENKIQIDNTPKILFENNGFVQMLILISNSIADCQNNSIKEKFIFSIQHIVFKDLHYKDLDKFVVFYYMLTDLCKQSLGKKEDGFAIEIFETMIFILKRFITEIDQDLEKSEDSADIHEINIPTKDYHRLKGFVIDYIKEIISEAIKNNCNDFMKNIYFFKYSFDEFNYKKWTKNCHRLMMDEVNSFIRLDFNSNNIFLAEKYCEDYLDLINNLSHNGLNSVSKYSVIFLLNSYSDLLDKIIHFTGITYKVERLINTIIWSIINDDKVEDNFKNYLIEHYFFEFLKKIFERCKNYRYSCMDNREETIHLYNIWRDTLNMADKTKEKEYFGTCKTQIENFQRVYFDVLSEYEKYMSKMKADVEFFRNELNKEPF